MNSVKARIRGVSQRIVPAGYRNYGKYGVFPEDWRITTLGEITSRLRERNGDSSEYPAYSINNQVGFIPQKEQFEEGSYDGLDKSSYRIVERGQFAYNPARINVGSIGVLKDCDKAIISSLYVCFDTSKDVCKSYLENWFRTTDFYKEIIRNTEGSVREYLFYENFSNIRIALPPLEEQKRIAEILECCDRVIRLKRKLIEEKKKQKKALMQKLLNPDSGFRLPGFNGEWDIVTLRDVCLSNGQYGMNAPAVFGQPDLPMYMRITDISDKEKYVNADDARVQTTECDKYLLHENDVVFVRTGGTVGKKFFYSLSDGKLVFAGFLIRFSIDKTKINVSFLKSVLNTSKYWKWVATMSQRSGQPGINAEEYGAYSFPIPTLNEQKEIGKILSTADHELDLLEQDLTQWERKKKSLMQLLFVGYLTTTK